MEIGVCLFKNIPSSGNFHFNQIFDKWHKKATTENENLIQSRDETFLWEKTTQEAHRGRDNFFYFCCSGRDEMFDFSMALCANWVEPHNNNNNNCVTRKELKMR